MNASLAAGEDVAPPPERSVRFRRAGTSIWLQAYAFISIAFFSGALDRPLLGNPSSYVDAGTTPAIQIVGSLLIVIAGLITGRQLLYRPKALPLHPTTIGVALALLACWVLLSIIWSHDPSITFRRGVAFAGTVLVGWTIAAYIPKDEGLLLLGRGALLLIAVSAFLAIVNYRYSFHQAGEGGSAEHIGQMRGSFAHKNDFARVLALAVLFVAMLRPPLFGSRLPALGAVAAGVVMLALAGSAKIAIALPVAIFGAVALRFCGSAAQRVALLVFVGLPALFLEWSGQFDVWADQVFAALGRDPSMSGRDVIWAAAERSIANHVLIGQGYAAGWAAQAQAEILALEGVTIGHAHNGYLQTMLDVGLIGLILSLIPLCYILYNFIFGRKTPDRDFEYAATSFALFLIVTNLSGSYLSNYNDIFTVVLVYLAVVVSRTRREHRLYLKRRRFAAFAQYGRTDEKGSPGSLETVPEAGR